MATENEGADLETNRMIGERLKQVRLQRGLSQAGLAEQSGVFQQQTILKIEKGTRPLRLDEAIRLAQVLGVTVNDLLTSEDRADLLMQLVHADAEAHRIEDRLAEIEQERSALEGEHAALKAQFAAIMTHRTELSALFNSQAGGSSGKH